MLVGKDFDKITWTFEGWVLLEPNAFYGDFIIGVVSFYFFYKSRLFLDRNSAFFTNWHIFFLVFGLGFFMGGFGHLFFQYWGVSGKYFSWISGIFASYHLELAMISLMKKNKALFNRLAHWKLGVSLIGLVLILVLADLDKEPLKGLIIPTVNSFVGLLFALGYLGSKFTKQIGGHFKYLVISVLVMLPTIPFQAFKINLHQWFDRNDVSHVVLLAGVILYYKAVSSHYKFLDKAQIA